MSKSLVHNALSGALLYMINVVVAFLMSPIIVRTLGNRGYGFWELLMSVIGYMGLLDLGIGPALVRFVSFADGKGDRKELQDTVSTAFVFFLVVGTMAVLIVGTIGLSPSIVAGKESRQLANLSTVFSLLALNVLLLFPLQLFVATLMGVQRHTFINVVRVLLTVMRTVVIYLLLRGYPTLGLTILVMSELATTIVQLGLFSVAVRLDSRIPAIALSAVSSRKLKELLSFGAKSALMLVSSRLQNQSVPIIIGHMFGLSRIVYFAIPNRLVDYARGVALAVGLPLSPYFGAQLATGNTDRLKESWLTTAFALQVVTLVMPVAIILVGEDFIRLWIGADVAANGRGVLLCLTAGLVVHSICPNALGLLTAAAIHGQVALFWVVVSAIGIGIGILGGRFFGVQGVAAATTIPVMLGVAFTFRRACRFLEISYSEYFRRTTCRLLLPVLGFSGTLWIASSLLGLHSLVAIGLNLLSALVVYGLCVWFLALNGHTRMGIRGIVVGWVNAKRASYTLGGQ